MSGDITIVDVQTLFFLEVLRSAFLSARLSDSVLKEVYSISCNMYKNCLQYEVYIAC
jgi:hypothetical protein